MIKLDLNINLKEIIKSIKGYDNYRWYIIYFYGYGKYASAMEEYLQKNRMREISIDELFSLEDNVSPNQIIDLSLVGFYSESDFSGLDFDEIIELSIIDIELIDSSYWEIKAPLETINSFKIEFEKDLLV